jgi:hypothetical protein
LDTLTVPEYKYAKVKSFIKDECYLEYKQARAINSRCDQFKCMVGPIFKLIEREVFKLKFFIKKVPMHKRMEFIRDVFDHPFDSIICTDFTQFEAHFTKKLFESVEFELYEYMTSQLPEHNKFMRLINEFIGGFNFCTMADITYEIEATRMSGEMCTSLGNGFSNLMFIKFICHELKSRCRGVAEGDDGMFGINGPIPTSTDFARLGLTIKLQQVKDPNKASFCGMIFDYEEAAIITNPVKFVLSIGWARGKYVLANRLHSALLKGKLLCSLYQYPSCPIVTPLTIFLNDALGDIQPIFDAEDAHHQHIIDSTKSHQPILKPIGMNTRYLMAEIYGITPEHQIIIESQLTRKVGILHSELLDAYIPNCMFHNFQYFVSQYDPHPCHCAPKFLNELNYGPVPVPMTAQENEHKTASTQTQNCPTQGQNTTTTKQPTTTPTSPDQQIKMGQRRQLYHPRQGGQSRREDWFLRRKRCPEAFPNNYRLRRLHRGKEQLNDRPACGNATCPGRDNCQA